MDNTNKVETTAEMTNGGGAPIMERAICVDVRFERFGNVAKLDKALIATDVDKAMLKASNALLDSPALRAINKELSRVKTRLRRLCLPSPFRQG